jgi:mannose-6-phosphate isomerase class I
MADRSDLPVSYSNNRLSNYDKTPFIEVPGSEGKAVSGWQEIVAVIRQRIRTRAGARQVVVIEYYPGVHEQELFEKLVLALQPDLLVNTNDIFITPEEVLSLTKQDVTDDEVFGFITRLQMVDFMNPGKLPETRQRLQQANGLTVVYGYGASLIAPATDILIYADMPRWELQLRYRRNEVGNLGLKNNTEKTNLQYKRGFYVDWVVADRLKKKLMKTWDYVLDTTMPLAPKMVEGDTLRFALQHAASRPFRVLPFFDPGVWGGQWLKEVCDLERSAVNYAWGFDCVPEENSLLLKFGQVILETPAINLVFYQSVKLLGEGVQARFGDEFPIRFDFLDTMSGGNLSLQVHPTTEYIREQFGMSYTQDESYYFLEAAEDACIYLGFTEKADQEGFFRELGSATAAGTTFEVEKYVTKWPVKKHDHALIPAGTIHCSGANSMVLEISATPFNFTFKLWDWERLGLDGRPRPININHGKKVLDWSRNKSWTAANLLNQVWVIASGDGWREERTGLHPREFIETRRHWFSKPVLHLANDSVHVLNLVEGSEAIVESPDGSFKPFVVHYAETFIVPASVTQYTIRPYGTSEGKTIATIKAFVRH